MKKLRELWYTIYPLFLSLCLSILGFLMLSTDEVILLLSSKNVSGALSAVITFASIIIGFVGVLLTAIVSIKRESELIQYFLKKANKIVFSHLISRNILSGIGVALASASLFFTDKLCIILIGHDCSLQIISGIFCIWIFLLSYFVLSTYKLMYVLLTMLIRSDEKNKAIDDPNQMSKVDANKLRSRHLLK